MKIYTGMTTGEKLDKIKSLDMGICISTSPTTKPTKQHGEVNCFLDNGAFPCFAKGYPFQADVFRDSLKASYRHGIKLDFIVCPDIVAGGLQSLDLSLKWAKGELLGTPNLALVVQDGMKLKDVSHINPTTYFSYIFIGGSVNWKWETAEQWVEFAHSKGMKCHIGQVGTLERLKRAYEIGADSVDSTSFVRNNSFHIVESFLNRNQPDMFLDTDIVLNQRDEKFTQVAI